MKLEGYYEEKWVRWLKEECEGESILALKPDPLSLDVTTGCETPGTDDAK